MDAAVRIATIPVEEYLEGEQRSEIRHEYLDGAVYAMAGASEEHNLIAGNLFAALHAHLRGRPCRAFVADMKVRVAAAVDDTFYYPDVMVACDPRDSDRFFKQHPRVLIEVLSPETERTDRREKLLSYLRIDALEEYVLVAQDRREITVYRRCHGWRPEVARGEGDALELNSLGFRMTLDEVYAGVPAGSSTKP